MGMSTRVEDKLYKGFTGRSPRIRGVLRYKGAEIGWECIHAHSSQQGALQCAARALRLFRLTYPRPVPTIWSKTHGEGGCVGPLPGFDAQVDPSAAWWGEHPQGDY